jgi:hypothetical protein
VIGFVPGACKKNWGGVKWGKGRLGVLLGGEKKQTHTNDKQTTKKWEADYTREVD